MLPAARQPGRCIYCAFRARQVSLQTRRLRSDNRRDGGRRESKDEASKIRYTNARSGGPGSDRGKRYLGRPAPDSVVRKFFKGKFTDLNPKEQAQNFRDVLHKRLGELREELSEAPLLEQLAKERQAEGLRPRSFKQIWNEFEKKMAEATGPGVPYITGATEKHRPVLQDLREAFRQRKERGLDGRIKYHFYEHLTGSRFTKSDIRNQQAIADLRYPTEWFPATRMMHRSIHLHVGPTNSGKTYHALQRLEQASTGVYAGPLRLLAHEVYTRMNAKGRPCSLITGEERRAAGEDSEEMGTLQSCTVEMMPLNTTVDVAVIDEIQMLGNRERGWAWTQGLLGVKAREVHLCGEERTVPLVKELCASVGETVQIHRYQRLSPLEMAESSLGGSLKNLRKGDCIVSFSVMGIHALRKQIERSTGKKVATVYGSLPPETRAQQARLFNDPNNDYDFLVASDAVGMGLNLAIKRIIFEASAKFDGVAQRTLSTADIKQIAGRAGRYRTAAQANEPSKEALAQQDLAAAKGEPDPSQPPATTPAAASTTNSETTGFVTTLEDFDFPIVQRAMTSDPEPIKTAGLFPPSPVLERFASYFPVGTPFSYILTRLHESCQMHTRFHLCGLKDQIFVADLIEPVQGLTVADRNVICSSPASLTDLELWKDLMPAFARVIAEQSRGSIVDIPELPLEVLEEEANASREYLRKLERLHKGVVNYLWLSYRFAGVFGTRALAFHIKGLVEEKIENVLSKFSFSETERRKIAARREKDVLRDLAATEAEDVEGEETGMDDVFGEGDSAAEEDGLEGQTSVTSGGDHVSGEEDVVLEDPAVEAEVPAAAGEETPITTTTSSFAEWRHQQTRGESQGSRDVELENEESSLMGAALEGESRAQEGNIEIPGDQRPPAVDIEPEAAVEAAPSSVKDEDLPPTGVPADLDSSPVTPEPELEGRGPLPTQQAPPEPVDARTPDEEAEESSRFPGEQMPLKHLGQVDVGVGEPEREQGSRP